jgi:hypothetical protein
MSAITETTVTNNATVDVATTSASALKKSFPAKYLKVLSVSLYLLKKMHPDVYVDKFVEHMKLNDSIESVMSEIDEHVFAAANELENEVRQIKRDLGKKPKKSRVAKSKKVTETKGTTEQIVELANEPTIVRGCDEPVVPAVPQEPKKTKKSKKAPVADTAPVVTETVTAPVVETAPAPVVETAPAPVVEPVVEVPKAKVTKAKVPKVPKDTAAVAVASEPIIVPTIVKEELDVGEPKVTAVAEEPKVTEVAEVAKQPALSEVSKKATKKAPKALKKEAPVQSEIAPSEELVEESEQ